MSETTPPEDFHQNEVAQAMTDAQAEIGTEAPPEDLVEPDLPESWPPDLPGSEEIGGPLTPTPSVPDTGYDES